MEIANAEQAAAWNGHEGEHWTEAMAELEKTVTAHESSNGVLFGTSAWLITARRA